MQEVLLEVTCSREGCNPQLSKGCIEGFEVTECPHRHGFVVPDETTIEPEMEQVAKATMGTVRVSNGDAFTTPEADLFLRKSGALVIAILGCPDAGKTTAAVMLYELIKRARLGKFSFAGSRTIRGFQSRSFRSILSSGLDEPETERTHGSKPVEFLHLRVAIGESGNILSDVLLVDRTGEDFEACMKKPDLCATFPEIPRADCHVLLVDGKKLADDNLAALHLSEVLRIFLSLNRNPIRRLQLVLTKYDKVVNSKQRELAIQRFEGCRDDLRRRLQAGALFTSHYLAARPSMTENNEDLVGHGLEELIDVWFKQCVLNTAFRKRVPRLVDGCPFDMLLNTLEAQA